MIIATATCSNGSCLPTGSITTSWCSDYHNQKVPGSILGLTRTTWLCRGSKHCSPFNDLFSRISVFSVASLWQEVQVYSALPTVILALGSYTSNGSLSALLRAPSHHHIRLLRITSDWNISKFRHIQSLLSIIIYDSLSQIIGKINYYWFSIRNRRNATQFPEQR